MRTASILNALFREVRPEPGVLRAIADRGRYFRGEPVEPNCDLRRQGWHSQVELLVSTGHYAANVSTIFAGIQAVADVLRRAGLRLDGREAALVKDPRFELGDTDWDRDAVRVRVTLVTTVPPAALKKLLADKFEYGFPPKR